MAVNRDVDGETAAAIASRFVEVVIAPGFSAEALAAFSKKTNLRILSAPLGSCRLSLNRELIRNLQGIPEAFRKLE